MSARRKTGKGPAVPLHQQSPREAEEEEAEEEERGPGPGPGQGPGAMVWALLVLLAAGLGAQGWLLSRQGESQRQFGDSMQLLRSRLQGLDGLREQVLSTVELGQRMTDMEVAQTLSEQKLEKATSAAEQVLSSDPIAKLSALQSEVRRSLGDIRKEFPSRADLDLLQSKVANQDSVDLEKMGQTMVDVLETTSQLKENISQISNSLSKSFNTLEQTQQSLQDLQQKQEVISKEINEGMTSLAARMVVLDAGLNRTLRLFEDMSTQLEDTEELMTALKETRESSSSQQLEELRELIQQLQKEKSAAVEEVSSVRRQVADQRRELEGKAVDLESALGILQARVVQVETRVASQNVQVLGAVQQELQHLKKKLDEMESSLRQCFSGEVETFCETIANCGWPHVREVIFPHRLLREPAVTLGVSGLSAQGPVGVSVKAVDVMDSGFKVQISNLGDHHLSSVKVTWMVCA
ncbi:centriolin-like [Rhinatrema bivittatum]|uniref:centriolin-like n=1 Tax=Rhinatrema bivittatum TaxID=194408 RepID=UPI00112966BF|nr:centriolin-like [Rhinatrema bivittatum]